MAFFSEIRSGTEILSAYLESLHKDRLRYYRSSVKEMSFVFISCGQHLYMKILEIYIKNKVYNVNAMKEIAETMRRKKGLPTIEIKPSGRTIIQDEYFSEKTPDSGEARYNHL